MVGIPLDRSCLKKMERCGTNRQISKSSRCWSCKLTKSQLPHLQDDRTCPFFPLRFFPVVLPDRVAWLQLIEWGAGGCREAASVWLCAHPNHQKLKTWIHQLSGSSGFHLLLGSLSRSSTKHSRLFTPGYWIIQNQAQFQLHNKTIAT